MKSSNRLKPSYFIAFLLIICGFGIILFYLAPSLKNFLLYKSQEQLCANLNDIPNSSSSNTIDSSNDIPDISKEDSNSTIRDKFLPLLEVNKEIIGWITINGTPIDYPMVQHSDNQYYLTHDSKDDDSIYGSIYIDHRNNKDLSDQNTLIYGHNMNNGSMFHALVNYKKQDFFDTHPYIFLSTLSETFTYEVFSVYVVDADTETIGVHYKDNADFLDYISNCHSRSLFKKDISLTEDDQIISLVTCSYELDNARTVVQAKKIK